MLPARTPTGRHLEVLAFLQEFHGIHRYMPSVREIAAGMKFSSTSTVQYHLDQLVKQGRIERGAKKGSNRSLRVVKGIGNCPTCGKCWTPT